MNLAELLNLALPGGISATGAQGTGKLSAPIPTLNGEIGQTGEFAQLLEQAQVTPPVPLEANLAPPGDPPPSETNSGERGELKTNEPNAQSKKPDPTQAPTITPQATELMAAWMLAQQPGLTLALEALPVAPMPGATPVTATPAVTPSISISPTALAPVTLEPTAPDPQLLPKAPEGVTITKVTPELLLTSAPEAFATSPIANKKSETEPQTGVPTKPLAPEVKTEQPEANVPSKPEAAKPDLNPLQKGNPEPVKTQPSLEKTISEEGKTAVQAEKPVQIKPDLQTEPKTQAPKPEATTLEFESHTDSGQQDKPTSQHQPDSRHTVSQPTSVLREQASPEPKLEVTAPRTELQARLDAVADRAELLHATRRGVNIEIHTPDLGAIHLQIRQEGDAVTTRVNTENPDVRHALMTAQPRIEKAMEDRGLSLRDFNVSSTMSDSQHHQPGRNPQSPQNQRPMNHQVPTQLLNHEAAATQRPTVSSGRGLDLAI
jgi:flagellar hook-length control protein FliK